MSLVPLFFRTTSLVFKVLNNMLVSTVLVIDKIWLCDKIHSLIFTMNEYNFENSKVKLLKKEI